MGVPDLRILMWGWYGFENLGDDLLLETMLEHVDGKITIPMKKRYELNGVNEVDRSYGKLISGAFRNDVLIIGPGGLFPFDNKVKVLIYYAITKLWRLLDRKVIFFGIGISERMSSFSKLLWRKIAKSSDLFVTRSGAVLKKIQLLEGDTIHAMADVVFGCSLVNPYFHTQINDNLDAGKKSVVISVANLCSNKENPQKETVEKWIGLVEWLLNKGYYVDLVAFSKDNDDLMIDAMMVDERLRNRTVQKINYSEAMQSVKQWGRYRFAICMRFHSLVLSILSGIPAVPIAYGHKTLDLAQRSGLAEYTLVWNEFQSEYFGKEVDLSLTEIINKVEELCENFDEVKNNVEEHRKQLIDSAESAFKQLEFTLNK